METKTQYSIGDKVKVTMGAVLLAPVDDLCGPVREDEKTITHNGIEWDLTDTDDDYTGRVGNIVQHEKYVVGDEDIEHWYALDTSDGWFFLPSQLEPVEE